MEAAGNAAVPELAAAADLKSGGGAATVDTWPYPADPRLNEKQPLTWLRAAPFLALVLVGAALLAAGVLVIRTRDVVGTAVYGTGLVLVPVGMFGASIAAC